jgi:hypothetical protein
MNATQLLQGLEDYEQTARKHVNVVRDEFERVSRAWSSLDDCYQGDAASAFREAWLRASEMMKSYSEDTDAILFMLRARIEDLRQHDNPRGLEGIDPRVS